MAHERFTPTQTAIAGHALGAHEQQAIWLGEGAAIRVIAGSARLVPPPQWLAGQVVWTHITLHEGGRHVATHAGWHQVAALHEGLRWHAEPAPSLRHLAWRLAARLWAGWRAKVFWAGSAQKARGCRR